MGEIQRGWSEVMTESYKTRRYKNKIKNLWAGGAPFPTGKSSGGVEGRK